MTVTLTEQRVLGDLAERLVPVAASFVGVVREEDRDGVTAFLSDLAVHERDALLVILAAMIPEDRTPADLLSWVTWDEHGHPLPPDTVLVLHEGGRKRGPGPKPPGEIAPCGTATAAKRHYANGEKPCEPCRVAANAEQAASRQARREKAA